MALSRYARLDAYTSEELRREYYSAGPRDRVRLLRRLSRKGELGDEITQLAVEDQNAVVRQWIARNADLSNQQIERLRADSDDLVRVCLFENPTRAISLFFGPETQWLSRFKEATVMERLAMMRNPNLVNVGLIEAVFDPEDAKLEIDLQERAQLVFAFLSNKQRAHANLSRLGEWMDATGGDASDYVYMTTDRKKHFAKLWTLASRWPPEFGVIQSVYRNVSVDGETKTRIYQQCEHPFLRTAILENELPELDERGERASGPSKVMELAKKDEDERCRKLAYSKSPGRPEPTPVLNALSYIWTTAGSIVEMSTAVLLLRSAASQFEIVTYTLLIMIYVKVRLQGSGLVLFMSHEALVGNRRHTRLLDLLGSPQSVGGSQEAVEATHSIEEAELSRTKTALMIEACSLHLIGAGAAIYLVVTLVKSL